MSANSIVRPDSPVEMIDCVDAGATVAQQVRPKIVESMLLDSADASRALSKFAWLRMLKNSERNCKVKRAR